MAVKRKISKTDFMQFLILLFLFFSAMPFLPQALYNIVHTGLANIKFQYDQPLFGINIRYFKDVIIFLFLILAFIGNVKKMTVKALSMYLLLLVIVGYGTLVYIFQNGSINYLQVIAGLRTWLFVLFCLQVLKYINTNFIPKLIKLVYFVIFVESVVIVGQYYTIAKYYGFVNPMALRLLGTFGGFSIVGYLALSCFVLIYTVSQFYKVKYKMLFYLSCIIIATMSGTRTAIVSIMVVIFLTVIQFVVRNFGKRAIYLGISFLSLAPILSYFIIDIVSKWSERGNLVENQLNGGRADVLFDFFTDNTSFTVIFGNGIGYGTNASVNLLGKGSEAAVITDGTLNSVLSQYGVFFVFPTLLILGVFLYNFFVITKNKTINSIALIAVTLFMCIATNIFEQYFFFFVMFITFYLFIISTKNYKKALL